MRVTFLDTDAEGMEGGDGAANRHLAKVHVKTLVEGRKERQTQRKGKT